LAAEAEADQDRTLQLQLAHDRIHLAFLKGQHGEAVRQAVSELRAIGNEYSHIRAYIAFTLMSVAADHCLPQTAFTLGVATKRLAGQARRPDLDQKASKKMRALEQSVGPEPLVHALQELRQVLPGVLVRRKSTRNNGELGGVG
jgi:hypothetical protein